MTEQPKFYIPTSRSSCDFVPTTICDYCQSTILRSSGTWGHHHSDVELFEISFLSGCVFCNRLMKHMESRQFLRVDNLVVKNQDGAAQEDGIAIVDRRECDMPTKPSLQWQSISWPVFRWTIRKLVKTREIQDCICITFRPMPAFDGLNVFNSSTTNGKDAPKELPDIVFYFYPDQGMCAFFKCFIRNTYAPSGLSIDACPHPLELGDRTDSEQTWAQIRTWNKKCSDEHHESCRRSAHVPEGIRLLEIGSDSSEWPPKVKLIERNSSMIGNEHYVTLSHCWGRKSFLRLLRDNYNDFTGPGIPWEKLQRNKNFVGAIRVAQKLGVRYVWIDSLCIMQSDSDDWNVQARKMKDVYRHSYCNIAASSSPDCDGGLFHDRNPDRVAIARYIGVSGLFQGCTWRVVPGDLWTTSLLDEALYHRAWVFQGEAHPSDFAGAY
jgi:hypothetical protein